jgi:hypothetical protein
MAEKKMEYVKYVSPPRSFARIFGAMANIWQLGQVWPEGLQDHPRDHVIRKLGMATLGLERERQFAPP